MVAAPHFDSDEAAALDMLNAGRKARRDRLARHADRAVQADERRVSRRCAMAVSCRCRNDALGDRAPPAARPAGGRDRHPGARLSTTLSAACPISSTATSTCICFRRCATPLLKMVAEDGARMPGCGNAAAPRSAAAAARPQGAGARHFESWHFAAGPTAAGLATNPAFAGAYDFTAKAEFAATFPRFLAGLPDGGLIMCHPGFVDAELEAARFAHHHARA